MKLYNRNELKDSRIFFDQRPPAFLTVFICFLLAVLILTVVISRVVDKPYIVKAQGIVTTSDNHLISSQSDGEVATINMKEGQQVKPGDTLFIISNGQEGLQQSGLTSQIDALNEQLKIMDKYAESLKEKVNKMQNSDLEQEYYGKVEYYLLQLRNDENQKKSIDTQLKQKQVDLNKLIGNLATYTASLNATPDTPDNVAKRSEIQGNIGSTKSGIDSDNQDINQLQSQENSAFNQSQQTYDQLISDLGTERQTAESKLVDLNSQISVYSGQDSLLVVKAKNDGIVHYLVPIKTGMSVQKDQVIGEISKNKVNDLQVEAYIQAQDISKVKIGDEVSVALSGVDSQKYGNLKGKLVFIDSGTITQQSQNENVVLYKCLVSLANQRLVANDGSVVKAIKSMPVEARIIYEKETYYDWVLEMLNFKN